MSLKDSVAKITSVLIDESRYNAPSFARFRSLNVEKLARKLELSELGKEQGEENLPHSDDGQFDAVEQEIIDAVEEQVTETSKNYEQSQLIYEERFFRFSPSDYGVIETDARDTISEFRTSVDDGKSQLEIPRERLQETAQERREFRKEHGLNRTAHYPDSGTKILQWGFIGILFLIESVANGNFLAKGNDYGLIGGWVEATSIAFLNIGVAYLVGYSGLRQLAHRSAIRKLLGLLSLLLWMAFTMIFNLLVAHYRETSGKISEVAGVVITDFVANPISLTEFQSWVLFGIGVLFALATLIDAFKMDDTYPFYGKLDRKYEKLRLEYIDLRSSLIGELDRTQTDVIDDIKIVRSEIDKHSSERRSIAANCREEQRAYAKYLEDLEKQCNQLLTIYRDANNDARSTDAPKHFSQPFVLKKPIVNIFNVPKAIETMQLHKSLQSIVDDFYSEFDEAVRVYPQLEVITRKSNDG